MSGAISFKLRRYQVLSRKNTERSHTLVGWIVGIKEYGCKAVGDSNLQAYSRGREKATARPPRESYLNELCDRFSPAGALRLSSSRYRF